VSPDLVKAIKGRKKNLDKIWSGKEWKEHKTAFLKTHPWCEMHYQEGIKVTATIPHHPYRNSYKGHYTDLELSQCVAYCKRCHFALHKGRKLCPVCKENYPRWDQEMCWSCFCKKNPDILKKINAAKLKQALKLKELRDLQKLNAQAWKAKQGGKKK
jgi:hypothetical protein